MDQSFGTFCGSSLFQMKERGEMNEREALDP